MNSDSKASANTAKQSDPTPSSPDSKTTPTATPITGFPPAASSDQQGSPHATPTSPALSSFIVKQLQCPNEHRPFVLQDEFEKLVLRQCTSSRFKLRPAK